ncbi:hypothetical protein [Streptomyces sp. MT206]|uniref:hypothetical protein n=1 Tax=Streptomyces sp. MT206 TaxID=3031407 RepID=UPI002FCAB529
MTALAASASGTRRLVPAACPDGAGRPETVHLAVLAFQPHLEEWQHGDALCQQPTAPEALPGDTTVTCAACETWRPWFETALARPARDGSAAADGWEFAEVLERDVEEWAKTGWRLSKELLWRRTEIDEVRASCARTTRYLRQRLDAQAKGLPIPPYPDDPDDV